MGKKKNKSKSKNKNISNEGQQFQSVEGKTTSVHEKGSKPLWEFLVAPIIVTLLATWIISVVEDSKPSKFFMMAHLHEYTGGYVNDEFIPIYSSNDDYCTLLELSVANGNKVTVDIKDIIVEVVNYKDLSEFIIKNPVGGADLKDVLSWSCSITPEKKEYYSIFLGTDQNSEEDISNMNYVAVSPDDTGEFDVKIYPDTPGLYEIKAIIEYTYKGKIVKKESESKRFVFDPNHEAEYKNDTM